MSQVNSTLLKLQYEILNVPVEDLAAQMNVPVSILHAEILKNKWTQLWPDEPVIFADNCSDPLTTSTPLDIEQRTEMARKRLQFYQIMKDTYLSSKYLTLESAIIDSAISYLDTIESQDAKSLHRIASMYKLLCSCNTLSENKLSLLNESNTPLAIIRDLTGQQNNLLT